MLPPGPSNTLTCIVDGMYALPTQVLEKVLSLGLLSFPIILIAALRGAHLQHENNSSRSPQHALPI